MTSNRLTAHWAGERGAVIVHVTIALIGLLGFSAFVIDYGVMWTARRQAQNAADAAALAGAISLAYVDFTDQDLARQSALAVAAQHKVWGEAPDVTAADVTFPVCPPGSPGAGTNSCIRVDVFRNQREGGSPLPTFFAKLVGVEEQGVRATATAEALFGDSTDCVKPFAIPDKWLELFHDAGPTGWSEEDSFERYIQNGKDAGQIFTPVADVYPPGSGYSPESVASGGGDHGRYITLKNGGPHDTINPGWFHPVAIGGTGGSVYENNIANCNSTVIGPGTVLDVEPGNMQGPTKHGMADLIALDPYATWDPNLYGTGQGGVKGGCMAAGTCSISKRLIAIPVYDPDAYNEASAGGRTEIVIVKVIGFFIDKMQGDDVKGWITTYPSDPTAGMGGVPGGANFVVSVALVR
jgi:hypothetical protein